MVKHLTVIGDIDLHQIGFQVKEDCVFIREQEKLGEEEINLKKQTREDIDAFESKKQTIQEELESKKTSYQIAKGNYEIVTNNISQTSILNGDCDQIDENIHRLKQDTLTKRTYVAQLDNEIKEQNTYT